MKLLIQHRVPLEGYIIFDQWLPAGQNHGVTKTAPGMELRLWLDLSCVQAMGKTVDDAYVLRQINVAVTTVLVDVHVDAPDDLAHFILRNHDWPRVADILNSEEVAQQKLAEDYQILGFQVLDAVVTAVNRLCSWAYANKNHHWLGMKPVTHDTMMSQNVESRAVVSTADSPPVRWCPPNRDRFRIGIEPRSDYIRREDWDAFTADFRANKKPGAVRELLSNATSLLRSGRGRAAVMEAATALEIALNGFASKPCLSKLRTDRLFAGQSLKSRVSHLGFSTSVEHLLPLLFAPDSLDEPLLKGCVAAIACRNQIAHHGQRTIRDTDALRHVEAMRRLALKLLDATELNRDTE